MDDTTDPNLLHGEELARLLPGYRLDPEPRDSVFLYGTPEGEEILMWEPGPAISGSQGQNEGEGDVESEGPDPWTTMNSPQ
jgi:hypothetical protein